MNDVEYIVKIICEQLANGSPLVLASIVSQQGSGPRHVGTRMVIGVDGKGYGTIGGSLLEATTIREGSQANLHKHSALMDFDMTGSGADSSGMICGGKVVILLDYIEATEENLKFFQSFSDAMNSRNDFYSLTYLKGSEESLNVVGRSLLFSDGKILGSSPISAFEAEILKSELHNVSATEVLPIGDLRIVIDRIQKVKTLYCFGAGHVAVPTVHIAAMVGFRVVVLDDRIEFANAGRFPDSNGVHIIRDFNQALEGLEIDTDSFIVILTRGHRYDREVLEQALGTRACYIGMISSRKKKEAIFKALLAKGATKEELDHVHSPIGIAIGAQTPEEIAVSIVAELISERQRMQM